MRCPTTDAVTERCFTETSTHRAALEQQQRIVLPRTVESAACGAKHATRPDGTVTSKLENDALAGDSLAERRRARQEAEAQ